MAEDVIFVDTPDVAWGSGDVAFATDPSIVWSLGISSADAVPLVVDFTYKRRKRKVSSNHRSLDGSLYMYKWSDYEKFRVRVNFLTNSQSSLVNSWFDTNTALLLFVVSGGVTEVNSVKMVDAESPIQQMQLPYVEYFKGVINLEGY